MKNQISPKASELYVVKLRVGKWHACHSDRDYSQTYCCITGYGNTADNAIKDYQKQFRNLRFLHVAIRLKRV